MDLEDLDYVLGELGNFSIEGTTELRRVFLELFDLMIAEKMG